MMTWKLIVLEPPWGSWSCS